MAKPTKYICPECQRVTLKRRCPYDDTPTIPKDLIDSPGSADPLVGTDVDGKFHVEARVARGGMATVYKVRHIKTEAAMALKVLSRPLIEDLKAVRRFYNEAKLAATLQHPNTVRVFDYGSSEDGSCYIAMEYLEGRSLAQEMRRGAPPPMHGGRIVHIATQVLCSLGEAHDRGLVHRDLKPDNIFLIDHYGAPDFVKVLDFGIAKAIRDDTESLTETGTVVGTPKYISPEQAEAKSLDGRSDLYSLGCMLYEMVCGRPPFQEDTSVHLLMRHVHQLPDPITDLVPEVHPQLAAVIMQLLSKKPAARPDDAAHVIELLPDLEPPAVASENATVRVPMPPPTGPTNNPTRPIRTPPASAALVRKIIAAAGLGKADPEVLQGTSAATVILSSHRGRRRDGGPGFKMRTTDATTPIRLPAARRRSSVAVAATAVAILAIVSALAIRKARNPDLVGATPPGPAPTSVTGGASASSAPKTKPQTRPQTKPTARPKTRPTTAVPSAPDAGSAAAPAEKPTVEKHRPRKPRPTTPRIWRLE